MRHLGADELQFGFLPLHAAGGVLERDTIGQWEALGIDSLWAPGHIAAGRPVPEALTGLARLASLTARVTVGTAVVLVPLYHPVILAKQIAEIDRSSGGRVVLGVGVGGEYESEFRAVQAQLSERGPRADEAITVLRGLWTGADVDNAGPFWPFTGVSIAPLPVQPAGPPVVVAGRAPAAMRRAAHLGDGWMPFLYSPSRYLSSVETIRAHARAAGRDLDRFQWFCFVYVSDDDDSAVARQRAIEFIGAGQAGDGARFEQVIDRVAAFGTRRQVTARLQAFVDSGARHFVVVHCDVRDPLTSASRFMAQIAPALEVRHATR